MATEHSLADAAWASLRAAMSTAEAELAAAAPDAAVHAEGMIYLARLQAATLERVFSPEVRTVDGLYYAGLRIGGANPDYRMAQALIDPNGRYELSGYLNDAERIGVGLYSPLPAFGLDLDGYLALGGVGELVDAHGHFTLTIGSGESDLPTRAGSVVLMLRELYRRPGRRGAALSLRRIDEPATPAVPPPPTAATFAAQLDAVGNQVLAILRRFLQWSITFAAAPNRFTPLAEELDREMRGDPDTRYYSGYFDLAENEALLVTIPNIECLYWGIQAINHWLEPIPRANLNDHTATVPVEGPLQVVIAARNPGLSNWLNTGGRRRGALFYRAIGADRGLVPEARVIRLD